MSNPQTPAPAILALAGDLLFSSRIQGTARLVGAEVVLCPRPDALVDRVRAASPDLVLVDLDARGWDPVEVIGMLVGTHGVPSDRIVAFVSHVRTDAIEAARTAGAGRVMARSAFVRALPELLRGHAP